MAQNVYRIDEPNDILNIPPERLPAFLEDFGDFVLAVAQRKAVSAVGPTSLEGMYWIDDVEHDFTAIRMSLVNNRESVAAGG